MILKCCNGLVFLLFVALDMYNIKKWQCACLEAVIGKILLDFCMRFCTSQFYLFLKIMVLFQLKGTVQIQLSSGIVSGCRPETHFSGRPADPTFSGEQKRLERSKLQNAATNSLGVPFMSIFKFPRIYNSFSNIF